jgi:hypothetical protein
MKALTSLFLFVILPLLLAEFTELAPWLAKQTVRLAVKVLPSEFRGRLGREWQGDVDRTPGKLLKLGRALGFMMWAYPNRRAVLGLPTVRDAVSTRISDYLALVCDRGGQVAKVLQARARRILGRLRHRLKYRHDDRARPPPVVIRPIVQWTQVNV